jgi:multidrug efflux pump subunit AcrA (membrane-fusion protein)
VKVGQPAEVQVETLPDKIFAGKVVQMYPRGTVENDVVTFMVRVEILEPNPLLKPAMTAEVKIICARKKQVLAAPTEAIFRIEGQSVAELYKGEDVPPEQVPVVTGLADFEWTEIVSGLKEGDQLVLESTGGMGGPGGRPGGNSRAGGPQENMRRMMRMGGGPGGGPR